MQILIKISLQINLIGRLQLSTERSQQEDNQSIVQLRILRTQEAIIKIMKMRKRLNNASLQVFLYKKKKHKHHFANEIIFSG